MKAKWALICILGASIGIQSCQFIPHRATELTNFKVLFSDAFLDENFSKADIEFISKQRFQNKNKKVFKLQEKEQTLWLKATLPTWQESKKYLFISSIDQFAQVYINKQKIYQAGDFSSPTRLVFKGYDWHLIEIAQRFSGQEIYFRVFSRHYNIGLFGRVKLAKKENLFFSIFYQDLAAFTIAAFLTFFGLILLLTFFRRVKNQAYLWLSLFTLSIGVYSFLRLDLRTFLIAPGPHLFYIEIFALYSLVIWLNKFFINLFGEGFGKSLTYTLYVQVGFLFVSIVLAFLGQLMASLPYFQLLMLLSGLVLTIHLFAYALQNITYAATFAWGFLILFLTGLYDILTNLQLLPPGYNLTPFGSLFFVGALTLIIIKRYIRTQQLVRDFSHELLKRKQVEEQLVFTTEKAKAADKAKTEFLATMSHEIRTPLNIILGMGQLLADEKLNEKQSRYVSSLRRSGEVLMLLINDVLDISKIEAGKFHILNEPFNFEKTISELFDLFKSKAEAKKINFQLFQDTKIPTALRGDRNRLRQILFNLVSNAIKFTAEGAITITTKLEKDTAYDCYVDISIIDTGKGIDQSKLQSIFEPFTQEDTSTTREYGGSGLGLAISQKLANLMDGNIRVESTVSQGSTFTASLHFFKELDENSQADPLPGKASYQLPHNLKVLLVEDLEENRLLVNAFLKEQPIVIHEVINGKEAVEKVKLKEYHIILMDMQMPVLDGYQATREIRQLEKALSREKATIIAVTGNAMSEEIEKAFDCGCNHHLAKPIDKANLLHLLDSVVKTRQL